jgi:hypothetical protein
MQNGRAHQVWFDAARLVSTSGNSGIRFPPLTQSIVLQQQTVGKQIPGRVYPTVLPDKNKKPRRSGVFFTRKLKLFDFSFFV